jgi:hypothetical protein
MCNINITTNVIPTQNISYLHNIIHIILKNSCVGLLHEHEYFQENVLGQFPLNSHMILGGCGSNIAHNDILRKSELEAKQSHKFV